MQSGVSIVVATYYRPRMLRKVLESLISIDRDGYIIEIVLVRDRGDTEASSILREYSNKSPEGFLFREVVVEAVNVDVERNAGIKASTYDVVGVVDDDVMVNKDVLRSVSEIMARYGDAAGACYPAVSDKPVLGEKLYYYRYLGGVYADFPAVTPVTFFQRKILEKTGYYREDMGPPMGIHEDWELGSRIRRHGYRLVFDGRISHHHLLHMRSGRKGGGSLLAAIRGYISAYFRTHWWSFLQVLRSGPTSQLIEYLSYFMYPWLLLPLLILRPYIGFLFLILTIIAIWIYSFSRGYYRVLGLPERLAYSILVYAVRIFRSNISFTAILFNIVLKPKQ